LNEKKSTLPVKSDVIFRLFFADERNIEFLTEFLKSVLQLPEDDYEEIEISDPHLLREFDGDKLAIIDVKLRTKSKKIIHIEIQLKVSSEFKERIIYYSSKLITEQIGSGKDYDVIKKVISIVITEEELIENSKKYHHRFVLTDTETGIVFSDLMEIHTVELGKLPDTSDGTQLYDWASFIAADTEEELDMLAERNTEVGKAVVKLRELSADEKARDLYERREKARRDLEMFIKDAKKEGRNEGLVAGRNEGLVEGRNEERVNIARNLIGIGVSIEQIETATGLRREEIERLRQQ